jgi:hypothetical protein
MVADFALTLTRYAIIEAARRSKGARRCADSGLSHGKLLRKEDYLKSGHSGVAF